MSTSPADQHPDHPVGFVTHAVGVGYFVKSRTGDGVWWLVSGNTCSCHAGRKGMRSCWHRRQVEAFCRKLNEAHARPTAPPATSMMFD